MLRWVTDFIHQNQENWDKKRKLEEDKIKEELESWNKSKRFEKIKKLKEKWEKRETVTTNVEPEKVEEINDDNWKVWRKKPDNQEVLGFDTPSKNPDSNNEVLNPQTNTTGKIVLTSPKLRLKQSRIQKYLHSTKKLRTVHSPRIKENAVQSPQSPRNLHMKITTNLEPEVASNSPIPTVEQNSPSISITTVVKEDHSPRSPASSCYAGLR